MIQSLLSIPSRRLTKAVGWSSPRLFSLLNRPPPKYDGHVPLTNTEKAALGIGAAVGAFFDPRRAGELALITPPVLWLIIARSRCRDWRGDRRPFARTPARQDAG